MSTFKFHPWNVGRPDVGRPDEWRIDLDPGGPKTAGGNGLHIYVRIVPEWGFADARRAA